MFITWRTALAATAAVCASTAAIAQSAVPSDQPAAEPVTVFAAKAMSETDLRSVAGREDVAQLSRADQVAGVSHNSVGDDSVTGTSAIGGNAFQNMSGLSILNVNTGNNVAINAAMNVNISITPGS